MSAVEARYAGICAECEEPFPEGTPIVRDEPGNCWIHETCPDPINLRDRHGKVCPRCFTERSLTGECGCDQS